MWRVNHKKLQNRRQTVLQNELSGTAIAEQSPILKELNIREQPHWHQKNKWFETDDEYTPPVCDRYHLNPAPDIWNYTPKR